MMLVKRTYIQTYLLIYLLVCQNEYEAATAVEASELSKTLMLRMPLLLMMTHFPQRT